MAGRDKKSEVAPASIKFGSCVINDDDDGDYYWLPTLAATKSVQLIKLKQIRAEWSGAEIVEGGETFCGSIRRALTMGLKRGSNDISRPSLTQLATQQYIQIIIIIIISC